MVGDSVIVTAEVDEYYDLTELKNIVEYYYISSYNMLPEPVVLPTGSMQDEQYEACLVRLENAACVRDTAFGMWFVNDGSGDAIVHNSAIFSFPYVFGNVYTITGPLHYDYGEYKIELRGENDVLAGIDSNAPIMLSVDPANSTIINIYFSEEVDNTTGSDPLNYSINNGIVVNSATLHTFDKTKVILNVSELGTNNYTLTVDGVEDLVGNPTDNSQFDFSFTSDGIDEISNRINIWPNPSNGEIFIESETGFGRSALVEIMDIYGRIIQKEVIESNTNIIPLSLNNTSKAVYLISITTAEKVYLKRIVIN